MTKLLIISDPGKALDDEEMLLLLSQLKRLGYADPLALVANLAPANLRAALAKGTANVLGMNDLRVGIGTAVVRFPVQDAAELQSIAYLDHDGVVQDGHGLLVETLSAADDGAVVLLLISAMTDAARLLRDEEDLFRHKIGRVTIMGGVIADGDDVLLDGEGFMLPDSATNNNYDLVSAEFLYRKLQELGIPMTVVSRHAAHAAKAPQVVYAEMAGTAHPVGTKLSQSHRVFVADFWRAVNASADDAAHEALPARWNRDLFLDNFCNGAGRDRSPEDSVYDLVVHATFSDPIALIAAVPELSKRYFQPACVTVRGTEHQVIGVSRNRPCLLDGTALISFLLDNLLAALGAGTDAIEKILKTAAS